MSSSDDDLDYNSLPRSKEDLIDDDHESDGDFLGFDEESDFEGDDNSVSESSSEIFEGADEEEDEVSSDLENDADEDEYDEEDDESSQKSKLFDILTYAGIGALVVGGGAAFMYLAGVGPFKPAPSVSAVQANDITKKSEGLRNVPASDVIEKRDSAALTQNSPWGAEEGPGALGENSPVGNKQKSTSVHEEVVGGGSDINRGLDLSVVDDSELDDVKKIDDEPIRFSDEQKEYIKTTIEDSVGAATKNLVTRADFDAGIEDIRTAISTDMDRVVKGYERKFNLYVENRKKVLLSDQTDALKSGREVVKGYRYLDSTKSGSYALVQDESGDIDAVSAGDSIDGEKVTGVYPDVGLILLGDGGYIDKTLVEQPKVAQKSNGENSAVAASKAKFLEDKQKALNLLRPYSESLSARNKVAKGAELDNATVAPSPLPENRHKVNRDYVMSSTPISNDGFTPLPNQGTLVVAEGWHGSMINGDVFMVTDPNGAWRKLRIGDRIADLGNGLVHGLDNKNNLIVGNSVILFNK